MTDKELAAEYVRVCRALEAISDREDSSFSEFEAEDNKLGFLTEEIVNRFLERAEKEE